MHRRLALPAALIFVLVTVAGRASFAEDEAARATQEPTTKPAAESPTANAPEQPAAKSEATLPAKPALKAVAQRCPATLPPVYVADWARLAALTQADPLIFSQVDGFAQRHDVVHTLSLGGLVLGGAAAVAGGFHAVAADGWSKFDKWSLAGGLGLAAVSLFLGWAMEPDRDDFFTLMNQWNLRHPQQVLAP